jgi:hypothetical protein
LPCICPSIVPSHVLCPPEHAPVSPGTCPWRDSPLTQCTLCCIILAQGE